MSTQLKNIENRLSKLENKPVVTTSGVSEKYDDSSLISRIALLENKVEALSTQVKEKQNQLKAHCDMIQEEVGKSKCKCDCNCGKDTNSEVSDEQKPVAAPKSKSKKNQSV